MQLQMKTQCTKCGAALRVDGLAYICSYECTFCSRCADESPGNCPNCGGELVRRPRRLGAVTVEESVSGADVTGNRPWIIWAVSFSVWTLVSLAASVSIYGLSRSRGYPMAFTSILGLEFCQILTYAPLTPFAFGLAMRFPIQRANWARRTGLHLVFGFIFSIVHTTLRFLSPFAAWDPKLSAFVSGIWNSQIPLVSDQRGDFQESVSDKYCRRHYGHLFANSSGRARSVILLEIPGSRTPFSQA